MYTRAREAARGGGPGSERPAGEEAPEERERALRLVLRHHVPGLRHAQPAPLAPPHGLRTVSALLTMRRDVFCPARRIRGDTTCEKTCKSLGPRKSQRRVAAWRRASLMVMKVKLAGPVGLS
jgi:hypothetical protein